MKLDYTKDENKINKILQVLGDPVCMKILKMTCNNSMLTTELTKNRDLPPTSFYRKLPIITNLGFLETTQTKNGTLIKSFPTEIKIIIDQEDNIKMSIERKK